MYKERLRRRADTHAAHQHARTAPGAHTSLLPSVDAMLWDRRLTVVCCCCVMSRRMYSDGVQRAVSESVRFRPLSPSPLSLRCALLRLVHAACNRATNNRTVLASIVSRMEYVAHFHTSQAHFLSKLTRSVSLCAKIFVAPRLAIARAQKLQLTALMRRTMIECMDANEGTLRNRNGRQWGCG